MHSCLCLFKKSWMALLALLLIFSSFLPVRFRFLSILSTFLLVVLSTVLSMVSNHKAVPIDKEKILSSEKGSSYQTENLAPNPIQKDETLTEANDAQEKEEGEVKDYVVNYSTTSPDLLSESEGLDQLSTSDDSELDWPFRFGNVNQSPFYSNGSISDEDSLIEIALPSGHYVDQQKDQKFNFNLQEKKQQELSAESILSQQSLTEFLVEFNDMNEEENLIEIDISMGSIMCSRFEIEA